MKRLKHFIVKLKLNWKVSKVKLFYTFLCVIEIGLILFIAWFNSRLLEACIIMLLFFIFRNQHEKQWHSKTLFHCACYSVLVFAFITAFIPSKNISILCSVFMPYIMTFISYHLRNYLDQQKLLNKKLESMTMDEMKAKFTSYTENEIKAVYDYINRKTLAENIAIKHGYSTRQLQRIIKKMKGGLN